MNRIRWLTLGAGALLGSAVVYAVAVEPRWLQVRRVRIHVRGLPPPLEGLRIALLTDLHAGGATPISLVRRAVELACRDEPQVVAITGDFAADDAPDFTAVLHALRGLSAPLGVYAVPGNHDYIVGIEDWRRQVAAHPSIRDLTNEYRVLDVDGARLCIAGVDDYYRGSPRLRLPPPTSRDTTILLAHSPDQAERCRRGYDSVDLILSGHTHAGQIRIPLLGAPLTSAEHPELYQEGVRRRPWTQVYISRGIGTVGVPARFLARPEVALLELTAEPRPPRGHRPGLPPGVATAEPPPQRIPALRLR